MSPLSFLREVLTMTEQRVEAHRGLELEQNGRCQAMYKGGQAAPRHTGDSRLDLCTRPLQWRHRTTDLQDEPLEPLGLHITMGKATSQPLTLEWRSWQTVTIGLSPATHISRWKANCHDLP